MSLGGSSRAFFKSSFILPSIVSLHTGSTLRSLRSRNSSSQIRMATPEESSPTIKEYSAAAESPHPQVSSTIDFLSLCHRLKTTKRAGWVRRGVQEPESIADHMYRMGVMALIAADIPGVDRERCVKMAIVHDIAEAIVGDITPSDGVPKEEKSRREREALDYMCKLLGGGSRAKEIADLWLEYEENSSAEAKVVKDFDKVLRSIPINVQC